MANNITIDRDAEARAVANTDKLADLADSYHGQESAHRAAVAEVARIEQAWASGDGTPTAQDHVLAVTEVKRTEALAKRVGDQLQRLAGSAPLLGFDFALTVAQMVHELYGETRTVVADRPPAETPKVGNSPLLYVVQSRDVHDEGGGILSADLNLALYGRSRIIAAPPVDEIERLFKAAGWIVDVTRHEPREVGQAWLSSVSLRVKRGWLTVPVIDQDADSSPRYVENRFGAGGVYMLHDLVSSEIQAVAQRHQLAAAFSPYASRSSIKTDGDGVIYERLVLPFGLKLDGEWSGLTSSALVDAVIPGLARLLVPGLGVIESVTDAKPERGHALMFTLVRREPVRAAAEDDAA